MDFSIILASRDRAYLLQNLIESVKKTTADLSRIEILVGIDDDDVKTKNLSYALHKYDFVKFFSRGRSPNLNKDYLNWLVTEHSKGKYFIICNDDTEFKTDSWDKIATEKLNLYLADKPDGIVYGYMHDSLVNRHGLGYCCFPLISRAAANAVGFAMPPEYPAWGADVALWRIYSAAERICDISEILIDHISQHTGSRSADEINHHVQRLSNQHVDCPVSHYTQKLKDVIKKAQMKPPSNIKEYAIHYYNEVMDYHKKVNYDTNLDTIWSNNMTDIYKIVTSSNTPEELIDAVDQSFMYSINFPPENGMGKGVWTAPNDLAPHVRERQIDWVLKKQKDEGLDIFALPEEIQESRFIHERNKVVKNGRVLSGNFMKTLSIAHRLFKYVDKKEIKNVIELGGGCGHQARTLSLLLPGVRYTIVDLPETLMFSFTYLSLCFPDKKILFVTNPSELETRHKYDLVFVPAVFAEGMSGDKYDLFINTASMGEMTNKTIHRWMDFIQNKVKIKYLYTLNRYLNVVNEHLAQFRRNENECSTSYDHKWKMLHWELEPIHCRCPFIDTLHSRYLEIIAHRPEEEPDVNALILEADRLVEYATSEDWYRLRGMYGDGLMQARSNVLVNDMTMTGTLFHLWESIRLDQNPKNVSVMIDYLNRIIIRYSFEEMFYYQDLLNRLPK